VQSLRDCSRQEKVSLFTLFTAALDTLLYRYTRQEDILLGIPLADRDRPELQSVIGFLLHTHVLRTQVSGELAFRDLLTQVQKGVLDLYAHRAVPFDQVVSKLQPERNLSYSPLFQVMINWRDRDQQLSFIGMDGLVVESLLAESQTSKFDLTVMLTDDDQVVWVELEYNTDLFDHDRMKQLFTHYQTLLEGIAAEPGRRIADLPLLTPAEQQQILVEWNATAAAYPKDRCLHELVAEQARKTPEALALVMGDRHLTYRELDTRADQMARHLQQLGVRADTLVAVCVDRCPEMVVALLAILKAGGAYVPLDPEYPEDRLAYMLEDARPTVLVTQSHWLKSLPVHAAQVVQLDAEWPSSGGPIAISTSGQASAQNLAYVIYTSGSTGKPKGVQIPHQAVVNFLSSMQREPGLSSQDALLAITTLSFDIAGLELWLPLTVGARVVIADRQAARDGRALAKLIAEHHISVMQATPSTWQMLLTSGAGGLTGLKVLCGGEPWAADLARQLLEKCASLWNMYGPTETTIWSAAAKVQNGQPIWIGRPIANTRFYVLDATGHPVPIGTPGELWIGGDGLARGYLNRPEMTAERFVADPFCDQPGARIYKTGDLVRWRAGGSIEYLGRLDQQVKIRGFRVELGEIESVLRQQPTVQDALVLARADTPGDKRLVAYVTPKDGCQPKAEELRNALTAKLPDYMVPAAFVTLERFPLMPNGKLDRKALPAIAIRRPELTAAYVPPGSRVERILADLWGRALGLEKVGIHDRFFDLGGHSLLMVKVQTEIRRALGCDLPIADLFRFPTVALLARHLEQPPTGENRVQKARDRARQQRESFASKPSASGEI
jgi:amino acid adenylation domain-containing protein